jgi:hypothetical protein
MKISVPADASRTAISVKFITRTSGLVEGLYQVCVNVDCIAVIIGCPSRAIKGSLLRAADELETIPVKAKHTIAQLLMVRSGEQGIVLNDPERIPPG